MFGYRDWGLDVKITAAASNGPKTKCTWTSSPPRTTTTPTCFVHPTTTHSQLLLLLRKTSLPLHALSAFAQKQRPDVSVMRLTSSSSRIVLPVADSGHASRCYSLVRVKVVCFPLLTYPATSLIRRHIMLSSLGKSTTLKSECPFPHPSPILHLAFGSNSLILGGV